MKLNILHVTGDYRGDHCADAWVAMDPIHGETVEELVTRAGLNENPYTKGDSVQIRLIAEADHAED